MNFPSYQGNVVVVGLTTAVAANLDSVARPVAVDPVVAAGHFQLPHYPVVVAPHFVRLEAPRQLIH